MQLFMIFCRCVTFGPDPDGANGVYLDKKIVAAAGACLESCLRSIAPKVIETPRTLPNCAGITCGLLCTRSEWLTNVHAAARAHVL
jgi:hypothetical protein